MRFVTLVAVAALYPASLPAEPRPDITVEWIYSDEGEEPTKLPETFWTTAGTTAGDLLVLDPRRPKGERTFERLDPRSATRRPAVDAKAALASLRGLMTGKDVPETLEWPASFDGAGRLAAYAYGDDLYLLDLAASRFERLTRTSEPEKIPRLSPDGRKLAFVRGNDLYLLDLQTKAETRLTADGSEAVLNGALSWVYWEEVFDHGEAGYWWSEDGGAIAFLRTDESPVSVVPFVDFEPAVPRVIRQRYPKAGGANPLVRLGIAAADGSKTVWLDGSEVPYEYLVRVKWLPDGRRLAVETLNRRQDRLDVYLMERASGRAHRILTETDPAWVNLVDLHFLADGRFLATSDRDGKSHLYRYSAVGERLGPVTKGTCSLRGPQNWQFSPVAASVVDEARGWVYFTGGEKAPVERQLYRVHLDGSGLEGISREPGVHRIEWSPDRRFYLDRHSSRSTPPSLSLHDAEGATKSVLAPPRSDLVGPLRLQYPELLTIPAADGFPLPARLYKPQGFDARRKYPLILYVYGEPNAPLVANAWDRDVFFDQLLLRSGYLVASVDPRSASGAGKTVENAVLRRVSGDVETDDLVAAVRWLKARAFVDPGRVGIWGWSGGGTYTLLATTRSQEFKAAIAVAPVTDRRYYDSKYAEAYMKTPEENADGYEYVSLVKRAKDLHGRLLLVFGTYDDNVHPQNSLHFADELIKAGKPFDMMVYPMRKHGIEDRAARRHLFNKMLEFWRQNL